MVRYLRIFIIPICFFLGNACFAQEQLENVDTLAGRFISSIRMDNREKLMVQTNKWFYAAGEELWLKAWIVNAVSHKYYSRSKSLYADLVNEKDTAVAQLILNIPGEQTEGYIPLPGSLPEGYYWLRVYTANMLKHDTGAIFIVPLYILNNRYPSKLTISDSANLSKNNSNTEPLLSIFPEGGSLISGTNTKVGYKATDKNGNPLELEGYVTDMRDSIVATFKTDVNGLAASEFYVFKSRKYTAHVKWNNKLMDWPLPAVNQYASQISVKDQDAYNLKVIISVGDSLYKKGKSSYMLGISRDSLCFASVGSDMYEINIPTNNFPAGMAKLLLFNESQEIVSERSVFIKKPKENMLINADKEKYGPREKVTISVSIGDSVLHPFLSALSVAVTDDSLVQAPSKEISRQFFSRWDTASNVSDLFLLTQAPSFIGKKYKNIPISKNATGINGAGPNWDSTLTDIHGSIQNRKNEPLANRIVTLYANKNINLFDTDTSNSLGQFKFRLPAFSDSVLYTLQVSNLKGIKTDDKIIIDAASPFPVFSTPLNRKQKLSPEQTLQLQHFRATQLDNMILGTGKEWLKEVIVKGKKKETSYNTSKRVSSFSNVITGDKLMKINPNDASTAMLTIPGLHLRGGFLSLGGLTSFGSGAGIEPLLVVDGVVLAGGASQTVSATGVIALDAISSPVMAQISEIPPDIIDFIEVLSGPQAAYYGARGSNGVILINTNRNSNSSKHFENYGTLQYSLKSYHLAPPFSMPDYSIKSLKSAAFKDNRSTLYWNGHIYTDAKGRASIEFYTADPPDSYTVTITGITAGGEIIYKKMQLYRK